MFSPSRTALITGAASGIGAAIARRLADSGITVICSDRDHPGAERVAEAIRAGGAEAAAVRLDIARPSDIDDFAATEAPDGLDILVNAAGIVDTTPTSGLTRERYREVLDIDLNGSVELTLALLPRLRRSAAGRILTIASIQGFRGTADSLSYATAKGGLVNFTRALAVDLAPAGVLVNALAPGFIDTPMAVQADGTSEYDTDWFRDVYLTHGRLPLGRPGRADEVAAVAEFFVSPLNSYITGQILAVDGGVTATF
jgi:3-oxoacyl-[acyl-carrier protein] reductase